MHNQKKYKIQSRSHKYSHSCLPLRYVIYWRHSLSRPTLCGPASSASPWGSPPRHSTSTRRRPGTRPTSPGLRSVSFTCTVTTVPIVFVQFWTEFDSPTAPLFSYKMLFIPVRRTLVSCVSDFRLAWIRILVRMGVSESAHSERISESASYDYWVKPVCEKWRNLIF